MTFRRLEREVLGRKHPDDQDPSMQGVEVES